MAKPAEPAETVEQKPAKEEKKPAKEEKKPASKAKKASKSTKKPPSKDDNKAEAEVFDFEEDDEDLF